MRNLKLTLAYDGGPFHGWQRQSELITIQGEMERAMGKLLNHEVHVHGSGRTDAGVHAHAQVANVETIRSIDNDAVLRGTNAMLPPEIRVLDVEEVPMEFHARRSARAKTYEYHVWRNWIVSPFHYRYVHAFPYPLDPEALNAATAFFVGTHDFTSFSAASAEVEDRVRTVYAAEWDRTDGTWILRIRGSGFLQHMVRTIAGTLLVAGQGKLMPERIPAIFEARDRSLAGPTAPARGLHLVAVEYQSSDLAYESQP